MKHPLTLRIPPFFPCCPCVPWANLPPITLVHGHSEMLSDATGDLPVPIGGPLFPGNHTLRPDGMEFLAGILLVGLLRRTCVGDKTG